MSVDGDKHAYVVDSIRKLLALKVSDQEILDELYDVAIPKADAFALLNEAKLPAGTLPSRTGQDVSPTQTATSSNSTPQEKDLFDKSTSELNLNDQIARQLGFEEDKSKKIKTDSTASQSPATQTFAQATKSSMQEVPEKSPLDEIEAELMAGIDAEEKEAATNNAKQAPAFQNSTSPKPTPVPVQPFLTPQTQQPSLQTSSSVNTSAPANNSSFTNTSSQQNTQGASAARAAPARSVTPTFKPIPQMKPFSENASPVPIKDELSDVEENDVLDEEIPTASALKVSSKGASKRSSASDLSSSDIDNFWKKGVVVAVNAKLSEMKRLKEDVADLVEEKVDFAVKKETKSFKVLLDSQKELIISSNKEALEQKQREIDFIIDAKINELKQYNKELSTNLVSMDQWKKDTATSLQQITSSLDELRRTKSQMIVEMNSELIKSKSSAQNFLDTADSHLREIDARVNRALELEKNIADGMLQQAEQKIESLTIQRADELIADMEVEVNRLKAIEKKISPETIDAKIQVLDEFKKQFLTSMQENLAQINAAIQEINTKNALADRMLKEKTLAIDAKLEELTKFEKEFSKKMESLTKSSKK